ncbi:Protein of unknown function, partial [Gryllus bimaculatus]
MAWDSGSEQNETANAWEVNAEERTAEYQRTTMRRNEDVLTGGDDVEDAGVALLPGRVEGRAHERAVVELADGRVGEHGGGARPALRAEARLGHFHHGVRAARVVEAPAE